MERTNKPFCNKGFQGFVVVENVFLPMEKKPNSTVSFCGGKKMALEEAFLGGFPQVFDLCFPVFLVPEI